MLRSPGQVKVHGPTWKGYTLEVELRREITCQDAVERRISRQRVSMRETKNVGLNVGLGIVWVAGAATVLGVAHYFPESVDATATTVASAPVSRSEVYLLGAGAAAGGLAYLIYGAVTGARGGEEELGPPKVSSVPSHVGTPRDCGDEPAPSGTIALSFAGKTVKTLKFAGGGRLRTNTTEDAAAVCGDLAHLGTPLRVEYQSAEVEEPMELARRNVDTCIRVTVAGLHLAKAATRLQNPSIPDLGAAADLLAQSEKLLGDVSSEEEGISALRGRLVELKQAAKLATDSVLDQEVQRWQAQLKEQGFAAVAEGAVNLLHMATGSPDHGRGAWDAVYRAATTAAAGSVDAITPVMGVVHADAATLNCVRKVEDCPTWLDREAAQAMLHSLGDLVAGALKRKMGELQRAAATAHRRVTPAAVEALDGIRADARARHEKWCGDRGWSQEVDQGCDEIDREIATAAASVASYQEELRRRKTKRLLEDWRREFARCREVLRADAQFQRMANCQGECRKALDRARAEWARLQSLSFDTDGMDDAVRTKLHDECEAAECPSCP